MELCSTRRAEKILKELLFIILEGLIAHKGVDVRRSTMLPGSHLRRYRRVRQRHRLYHAGAPPEEAPAPDSPPEPRPFRVPGVQRDLSHAWVEETGTLQV